MKGLFKRTGYFLLSSKLIITLSLFIGLSILVPSLIGISYSPHIDLSIFGHTDSEAKVANFKLSVFMIIMWIFLTAIIIYIPIKIFNNDKETNWDLYISATPVTRKSYVTEKYILTFIIIIVLCLFYSISYGVMELIEARSHAALQSLKPITYSHLDPNFDIKDTILFTAVLQSIYLIFISCIFPTEFNIQSNKARVGYVLSLVSAIVLLSVFVVIANTSRKENIIKSFFSADTLFVAFLVLLFSCGLYFLSWMLSVKLYKRKNF